MIRQIEVLAQMVNCLVQAYEGSQFNECLLQSLKKWNVGNAGMYMYNGPFAYIRVISAYASYALGGEARYIKYCITHIGKSIQRRALGIIIVRLDMLHE